MVYVANKIPKVETLDAGAEIFTARGPGPGPRPAPSASRSGPGPVPAPRARASPQCQGQGHPRGPGPVGQVLDTVIVRNMTKNPSFRQYMFYFSSFESPGVRLSLQILEIVTTSTGGGRRRPCLAIRKVNGGLSVLARYY